MLVVAGWASTSAIDAVDHSFEAEAIRWPSFGGLTPPIELLWNHSKWHPCGKILYLARRATPNGSLGLWIEASVSPEYAQAQFTGFSVRTKIERYEIKTIPRPYAVVTSAVLLEVSLVPKPANPDCTIQRREELPEVTPLMIEQINKARQLQRLIEAAIKERAIK